MLDPNQAKKKSSKPIAITSDVEGDYDPRKRDPKFAHASASPLWELVREIFSAISVCTYARYPQVPAPQSLSPDCSVTCYATH